MTDDGRDRDVDVAAEDHHEQEQRYCAMRNTEPLVGFCDYPNLNDHEEHEQQCTEDRKREVGYRWVHRVPPTIPFFRVQARRERQRFRSRATSIITLSHSRTIRVDYTSAHSNPRRKPAIQARNIMRPRLLLTGVWMILALTLAASCSLITETLKTGGEQKLTRAAPPPKPSGPHVIVFALDGAAPAELLGAVGTGRAPNIGRLLGPAEAGGHGLFAHAYAAPHAMSMLPSSTIADWASIFTGATPAEDGVPGDEWFERESGTFLAPVPVSVPDIADNTKTVTDDLIGHELRVGTLYA